MTRPVVLLAALLIAGVASPWSTPFPLVALAPLYLLARDGGRRAAGLAWLAVVTAFVAHDLAWGPAVTFASVAAVAGLAAAVGAAGLRACEARAAAERDRAHAAERAAADERLRIARDLHDAVGHDVSLMVVQAQALGAVADDPQVREAADAIAATGRRTMEDMHRTLRVLRADGAAPETSPHSLATLDRVIGDARGAGVPIDYTVEGAPRALSPALGTTAYRVVQEAVTNVVRHAAGAAASVTVRYLPDALELVIADEGEGRPGPPGHGLAGMRERVASFGGTLATGPRSGRGYEVRAVIPYR
jgi:signal transduction histidine kinase